MGMVVIGSDRMVMVVFVFAFLTDWGADQSVLMLDGPRVHVDLESGRRHFVANSVFNAHGEGMRILQR